MSRTIRRKHYVPSWVTSDWTHDRGHFELEGEELRKALRWWHEDKSCNWGARPPKSFRQEYESIHRMKAKTELSRFGKNDEYEVQLRQKARLGYWD